jgi:hypothetical protein
VVDTCRQYTFSLDTTSGFYVVWNDYWYNQFEGVDMVVSSPKRLLREVFPLPSYTYTQYIYKNGSSAGKTTTTMDPFNPTTTVSIGKVAPALLGITTTFTYYASLNYVSGHPEGEEEQTAEMALGVDVSRQAMVLWDYAVTFDGPPTMYSISLDEPAPQTLTFPGDYRRPGSARTTRILTDDELWAVNTLAGSIGVSGPQLLAILLELTGARRNAYHSDGCYGLSNLTKQQLAAAGLAGEGGVTQFVTASMHRQLAVTKDYLTALTPAVSGVIPVFFTLATGQPCQSATAASVIPGTTVTGADVATRIANRVDEIASEFAKRLPDSVTPLSATV